MLQVVVHEVRCPGEADPDPIVLQLGHQFAKGLGPRVVDVGDAVGVQYEGVHRRRGPEPPCRGAGYIRSRRWRTRAGRTAGRPRRPGPVLWAARCLSAPSGRSPLPAQHRVPGPGHARARWARATSAAATTPCSIPTSTTTVPGDQGQGRIRSGEPGDTDAVRRDGTAWWRQKSIWPPELLRGGPSAGWWQSGHGHHGAPRRSGRRPGTPTGGGGHRRAGWAGVDGEGAGQARQPRSQPQAPRSTSKSLPGGAAHRLPGWTVLSPRSARCTGRSTVTAVTASLPNWPSSSRATQVGTGVHGADHVDAPAGQAGDGHRAGRPHHPERAPGAWVHLLAHDYDGQHPGGDAHGPPVELVHLVRRPSHGRWSWCHPRASRARWGAA